MVPKSIPKRTKSATAKRGEPRTAAQRMADYRKRMRAAGLRPVQIWVPDTKSQEFIERARRAAQAIAKHDPAGDEWIEIIEAIIEWPE